MYNWAIVVEQTNDGIFRIGLTDGRIEKFIFRSDTESAAMDCARELKKWVEYLTSRQRPWGETKYLTM